MEVGTETKTVVGTPRRKPPLRSKSADETAFAVSNATTFTQRTRNKKPATSVRNGGSWEGELLVDNRCITATYTTPNQASSDLTMSVDRTRLRLPIKGATDKGIRRKTTNRSKSMEGPTFLSAINVGLNRNVNQTDSRTLLEPKAKTTEAMKVPLPEDEPTSISDMVENKRTPVQVRRTKPLSRSKSMEVPPSLSAPAMQEAGLVCSMKPSRQVAKGKAGPSRESKATKNEVVAVPQPNAAEELQLNLVLAEVPHDFMDCVNFVNFVSKVDTLVRRQSLTMSMDDYGPGLALPPLPDAHPQAATNDKLKYGVEANDALDNATTGALFARSGPRPMLPQRSLRRTKSTSSDAVSGVPLLKASARDNMGSSSTTSRRQRKAVRGDDNGSFPNKSTATKSRIRRRCSRSPIRTSRSLRQFADGSSSCESQSRSFSLSPGPTRRTLSSGSHYGSMRRGLMCTSQRGNSVRLGSLSISHRSGSVRRGSMSASRNAGSFRRSTISKSERNGSIRRGLLSKSQQSNSTRRRSLSKSQQGTSRRTSDVKSSSWSSKGERSDGERATNEYQQQLEENSSCLKDSVKNDLADGDMEAARRPETTHWACTCGSKNEASHNFCGMCASPKLWHCVACTFDNKFKYNFCGMCRSPNPSMRAESHNVRVTQRTGFSAWQSCRGCDHSMTMGTSASTFYS
jgi:hypothetical protein